MNRSVIVSCDKSAFYRILKNEYLNGFFSKAKLVFTREDVVHKSILPIEVSMGNKIGSPVYESLEDLKIGITTGFFKNLHLEYFNRNIATQMVELFSEGSGLIHFIEQSGYELKNGFLRLDNDFVVNGVLDYKAMKSKLNISENLSKYINSSREKNTILENIL